MLLRTSTGGDSSFQLRSVQAGTALELQRKLDEAFAELSLLPDYYLGATFAAAGDGSQWAVTVAYGNPGNGSTYSNFAGVSQSPVLLSTFQAIAPTTSRSRIVVAQGGTAEETSDALEAAVAAAQPNAALSSIACQLLDLALVGSANGQQWLGAAVLIDADYA